MPQNVSYGRESVTIYRRKTPPGNFAFMVANYSGTKLRFDSYKTETEAVEASNKLATIKPERHDKRKHDSRTIYRLRERRPIAATASHNAHGSRDGGYRGRQTHGRPSRSRSSSVVLQGKTPQITPSASPMLSLNCWH